MCMSVVSIGIDYSGSEWKLCLTEDGRTRDCLRFPEQKSVLQWLTHACTLAPEAVIGFSSRLDSAFSPLSALLDHVPPADNRALSDFLIALSTLSLRCYSLPALKYVSTVPAYRRLLHPAMGTANIFCSIATLLYRMREGSASWSEMRFLCLEIGPRTYTLSVVQDGLIIDGLAFGLSAQDSADSALSEQAFWEGLAYDLAGLMAVHHFEDIVISQQPDSTEAAACKEEVIQRLGDLYQFYLYPQTESQSIGFEAAIGAALLVAGFSPASPTAELASRLLAVIS